MEIKLKNKNLIKSRITVFHALSSIIRVNGFWGLYRGMSPALYGATASWGLYFLFYEHAKSMYAKDATGKLQPWEHFFSGMQAGAMCIPFTNPIWLIKVRMQVQAQTKPVGEALRKAQVKPYLSVTGNFYTYKMFCNRVLLYASLN